MNNANSLKEEVVTKIKFIRQQTAVMGANSSELPDLEELIRRVEAGECVPEEALMLAENIKFRKHDDH